MNVLKYEKNREGQSVEFQSAVTRQDEKPLKIGQGYCQSLWVLLTILFSLSASQ